MDEAAAANSPVAAEAQAEMQRILRQRNALLRRAKGILTGEDAMSLDVWDEQFAAAAAVCTDMRVAALAKIASHVEAAYQQVAGERAELEMSYEPSWDGEDFLLALASARPTRSAPGADNFGPS